MLFNSLTFFIFLAVVYILYRYLDHRPQNILLLIASYTFYAWWDIRFLFLIVLSTVINFYSGHIIHYGTINRKDRITLSLWAVLSCFFFVVIQWKYINLSITTPSIDWIALFSWQQSWLIFGGTCIITVLANFLYHKILNLEEQKKRIIFLIIGVVANLSILAFFKYFNFFIENLEELIRSFHLNTETFRLHIILPVGISFYTFQTMSYTIDIYRKKLRPADRYSDFALFVAFFPQLVAGPIERAVNLLPQIYNKRNITTEQTIRGLHLIFYGLFKKVAIADGVARTINHVYGSTGQVSWTDVIIGTVLFAIQIYCDFSGYSDIARGTAKLFGIDIMTNFKLPYFSQNPQEFWSRWHISLSTWLRDYLYISLGGNRHGTKITYRNLMLTMLLGGLWHGAAWNFVLWGFYHGLILCLHRIKNSIWRIKRVYSNTAISVIRIAFFFVIICYGWLLFRAPSLDTIISFSSILVFDFGNMEFGALKPRAAALVGLPVLFCIEFIEYSMNAKSFYEKLPIPVWTSLYAVMIFSFILGIVNESSQFIYFTF